MIVSIRLSFSNAYLVIEEGVVLVDTGSPGDAPKIEEALAKAGVALDALKLILLTHGHVDHAGSAAALRQRSGAPVAIHRGDAAMLAAGQSGPLHVTRPSGYLYRTFVPKTFRGVAPDLLVDADFRLDEFGIAGRVLETPGHTAGSISVLLADHNAIVGDLLMGGYMGGALLPHRPRYHYFYADSFDRLRHSLQGLLTQKLDRLFVGHGGPLTAAAVRQRFPSNSDAQHATY